jgi:hypothetical protein
VDYGTCAANCKEFRELRAEGVRSGHVFHTRILLG